VSIGSGGSPADRWFTTADVDGDGLADLVKYEPAQGVVRTWLSSAIGFSPGPDVDLGSGGSPADRWFTTADADGDGAADFVKYEPGNGFVTSARR